MSILDESEIGYISEIYSRESDVFKNAIDSLSNNVHGNTLSLWCENFIKFNLFSKE